MALTALGLGSQSSTQLTRTLEKVFEDAQLTGELKLSGRKLREYPKLASEYDLCDTVAAGKSIFIHIDRSDLRFQNGLTSDNCRKRYTLDSGYNTSDGSDKRWSQDFQEDISCNELSILPPQIGDLDSLKSLNIRRNQLVELPSEVCELQLVKLDISANRITTLPPNLRFMYSLQEFILDCNPLSSPPAFVCLVFIHIDRSDLRFQNGLTSDNCRKRYTLDSGYNTSDGSDKRWSQDFQELNGDLEDSHHLALRAAALAKGRQEREWLYNSSDTITSPTSVILNSNNESPNGLSSISTPSTLSPTSEINVEEVFMKESQKEQITDVYEQSKDDYRRMARKVLEQQREEARKLQERSPSKVLALKKDSCNINNSPVLNSLNCSQTCRQLNENLRYQTITDGLNKRTQSDKCHKKFQSLIFTSDYSSPSFTARREIDKVKEEKKQVDHLRCIIEAKLKVTLPEDLGSALMDGVVLCHLANRVRPHSVASIHVPSPAVELLCTPQDILEERGLIFIAITVQELMKHAPARNSSSNSSNC
ncbi:leucine-rich repeat and calponin homology domain-containing protein 3-like [Centruroides sculpturatus]|uniref:leucine-rich repeat and calponin homology domain-containing protein 3-like n=1 Tax=Centruroides sculpturatus TaxID=218467 RepID=UPI000C6D230A|nr:leucine-rich repeat and calponin homology domain-containing protein 3-like [Centruroides sculpturatus]